MGHRSINSHNYLWQMNGKILFKRFSKLNGAIRCTPKLSMYVEDPIQHDYQKKKPREWIHPNVDKRKDHLELPLFRQEFTLDGPPRGKPHSLMPIRIYLEKDKEYYWCACGVSK